MRKEVNFWFRLGMLAALVGVGGIIISTVLIFTGGLSILQSLGVSIVVFLSFSAFTFYSISKALGIHFANFT